MQKKEPDVFFVEDNKILSEILGPHNTHLKYLADKLRIGLVSRGNEIYMDGPPHKVELAKRTLESLVHHVKHKHQITNGEIDALIRMDGVFNPKEDDGSRIVTTLKTITARTPLQHEYIKTLKSNDLVFGIGPAGTGKTYVAVAVGVSLLLSGRVDRLILTRPAVEAGERLGFLPGDLKEKVDPYLRPIYDALHDMMPARDISTRLLSGDIEIAPIAFMRGRTLSNAYVILDEGQNTTPMQMKMFLTRMGENTKVVVTGDITQIDLPEKQHSGLVDAVKKLKHIEDIKIVTLTEADIVRHPLVAKIVKAYGND